VAEAARELVRLRDAGSAGITDGEILERLLALNLE